MSNKEILEKAIQKAIDGGWENTDEATPIEVMGFTLLQHKNINMPHVFFDIREVIFDHDFAKALWGEPWANFTAGRSGDTVSGAFVNWKGHLINMVVAEDPIKYLESNI